MCEKIKKKVKGDLCMLRDLDKYNDTFWDFKGTRKEGIHKLGKYPATMVAPMQYELLSIIKKNANDHQTLLDPFMGSGTTLVEGHNLGLNVTGIDINPYAVLLTSVKTSVYIFNDLLKIENRLHEKLKDPNYKFKLHYFDNITKWFRDDIIISLSKIRSVIIDEPSESIRKFLWVCFSEVIYIHSNDRTSTFKLHIKEKIDIDRIIDNCILEFLKIVSEKKHYLNFSELPETTLLAGNSLHILSELEEESIDIICTSPPYGENGTTVTYGQASILFLKWIDIKDLECESDIISNYSRIDSMSLGGGKTPKSFPNIRSSIEFIEKLSKAKRKKVEKFLVDYYIILCELTRILSKDGYILFTVGNRRVDGLEQPLDEITQEIFNNIGLKKEVNFTRKILSKKMPAKISNIENKGAVKSMSHETVLIFRKGE